MIYQQISNFSSFVLGEWDRRVLQVFLWIYTEDQKSTHRNISFISKHIYISEQSFLVTLFIKIQSVLIEISVNFIQIQQFIWLMGMDRVKLELLPIIMVLQRILQFLNLLIQKHS